MLFRSGTVTFSISIEDCAGNTATATATTDSSAVDFNKDAPTISSAATRDIDSDGVIDHYVITFSHTMWDSSFPGYIENSIGDPQTAWLVAGKTYVVMDHGTSVNDPGYDTDTANDTVIYIKFNEGTAFDTDDTPDLTTTATPGLVNIYGNAVAQVFTATVSEADGARPVITRFYGAQGNSYPYVDFSEPVDANGGACDTGNLSQNDFTYTDDGAGGASSIRNATGWLDRNGCDGTIRIRLNANIAAGDLDNDKISSRNDTSVLDSASNGVKSANLTTLRSSGLADSDGDGVPDTYDNCDYDFNPGQDDGDSNSVGDACEFEHWANIQFDTTSSGANVSGSQTNFPVLVRITDS